MKLLVNCANLHGGGGVAVASSFLSALSRDRQTARDVTVLASSEVDQNVTALEVRTDAFGEYHRFDVHGLSALVRRKPVRFRDYAVVYTLFGPAYALPWRYRNITGFAQPWIVYPHNAANALLSRRTRLSTRVRYEIQAMFFALADVLVVEQEHVRAGLRRRHLFRRKPIVVVPNTVDDIHFDPTRWAPVDVPAHPGIKLGVIARNYPHKNLRILPEVRRLLQTEHGLSAQMYVTLPDLEWQACDEDFRASVVNVGPLTLAQCPAFHQAMDGIVFPTLLECYSATPIEALAARKPLFVSDIEAVRESVGDHALYFDPLDPRDVAATIADYFTSPPTDATAVDEGFRHVRQMPTADHRSAAYAHVMRTVAASESSGDLGADAEPLEPQIVTIP